MGMRGINAFLKNHRCNAICKALKLPQIGKPAKGMYEGGARPLLTCFTSC
jgi:hypothetical protein